MNRRTGAIVALVALLVVGLGVAVWLTQAASNAASSATGATGAPTSAQQTRHTTAGQPGTTRAATRATSSTDPESGLRWVAADQLPEQARTTLRLIDANGPFPYAQDGTTFRNAERILPAKPAGYYREYTVPTPGSGDRGARRIIAGERGERYYTDDHYASFRRIQR